jgi:hypothetical protein
LPGSTGIPPLCSLKPSSQRRPGSAILLNRISSSLSLLLWSRNIKTPQASLYTRTTPRPSTQTRFSELSGSARARKLITCTEDQRLFTHFISIYSRTYSVFLPFSFLLLGEVNLFDSYLLRQEKLHQTFMVPPCGTGNNVSI